MHFFTGNQNETRHPDRKPLLCFVSSSRCSLLCHACFHQLGCPSNPILFGFRAKISARILAAMVTLTPLHPTWTSLPKKGHATPMRLQLLEFVRPCRSAIITGMYQNSIGTHHMRCNATLPTWLKPFPVYLREAGYYCTNNSKTDYQFSKPAKKEIWDICGAKGHWKNRPQKSQPFFAVFNFTGVTKVELPQSQNTSP